MDKLLNLIGLAKKAGQVAIGEEPVARSKHARLILIASDAADNTRRRALHFGEAGECICLEIPPTKEDLGRALGRTSCALLALTDIGFAEAVAKKLAESDEAHYGGKSSSSTKKMCAPARKSRIRKSRSPLPPQRPRARKRARASAREVRSSTDARALREKRRTAPRKSSARQGALPIPAP